MSDIDILRQRIEAAELRLRTAHGVRQRESAALSAMWDQIRDRFAAQSTEVVNLRGRVAELEDVRDRLQTMVRSLLGAVEGSIERMADETVPQIVGLAEDLLGSDPAAIVARHPAAPAAEAGAAEPRPDDDFLAALGEAGDDDLPIPSPAADDDLDLPDEEPASPGIRSLIRRIETAFERQPATGPSPVPGEETGLARDLDDIHRLRNELQSLRARIGAR